MSRIFILLLSCFLFTNFSSGQTYSSVVSDKEIYEFLNWMTKTEDSLEKDQPLPIYFETKKWVKANFIKDTAYNNSHRPFIIIEGDVNGGPYLFEKNSNADKLFNDADKAFLLQQYLSIKDSIWHYDFASSKLLKLNKDYDGPQKPCKLYSIPLFSIDRNYVMVYKSYHLNSLGGYGGVDIYRKIGPNRWEYVAYMNSWKALG